MQIRLTGDDPRDFVDRKLFPYFTEQVFLDFVLSHSSMSAWKNSIRPS